VRLSDFPLQDGRDGHTDERSASGMNGTGYRRV
jgi:hypothetical protein